MFLRFVRSNAIKGTHAREGFFGAAYELRGQPDVDRHTLDQLEDRLAWFRQNLAIPPRFNLSRSKGFYRRETTQGLSWFKPTATEHLARAFDLAALLARHGHHVDVMKSSRLGYVVYEDEYQIVAEPFSDTATG
ncbi:MAG: hypothetical protein E5Y04_27165 [Mesorhizobium sp.]|uniref:hypothetical protein n=1 Tax=Mesorhizobium sp. TaxID=1871066 RepID=UPI000FEAB3B3|nr:hypothetical protein [Mesorhizobium sp.]RWN46688.1 MAG: hypothetical protein EOS03_15445 [Mesorhizobium sp.]TJV21487.1 MAG: hypothetical protein E5Y04_27165 [Mesorhizobium sp.]